MQKFPYYSRIDKVSTHKKYKFSYLTFLLIFTLFMNESSQPENQKSNFIDLVRILILKFSELHHF